MDAAYQRQWNEQLVHRALWERCTGRDEHSRPIYDPPVPIRCFVEDISLARVLSAQERGVTLNYSMLLAGNQEVNNDDRFTKATDRGGTALFPSAVVIRVVNDDHRREGRVWRTAYLQLQ